MAMYPARAVISDQQAANQFEILLVFVCWFLSFVVFPPLLLLRELSWVFSGFRWFSSVFAISIPHLRGKQPKPKAGEIRAIEYIFHP